MVFTCCSVYLLSSVFVASPVSWCVLVVLCHGVYLLFCVLFWLCVCTCWVMCDGVKTELLLLCSLIHTLKVLSSLHWDKICVHNTIQFYVGIT